MKNKVLFWDFDGTLSLPNKSFTSALYNAVIEHNCRLDKESVDSFISNAYSWKSPFDDHTKGTFEFWWKKLNKKIELFCIENGVSEIQINPIIKKFKENLINIENYCLYDDTVFTLKTCKQLGFNNYLLTNNYPEIIENIEKLGIKELFSSFIISSHIGYEKPRKEIFDYAKRISGYPEICFMIGDNAVADIGGAKESNIKTIYVHNGYLDTADYCADTLTEIIDIIQQFKT